MLHVKSNLLLLTFTILLSITMVSALPNDANNVIDFEYTTPTNYSEVGVNDSLYWDGNAWSDTRWLDIDGGNANQDVDIGGYNFDAGDGDFYDTGDNTTVTIHTGAVNLNSSLVFEEGDLDRWRLLFYGLNNNFYLWNDVLDLPTIMTNLATNEITLYNNTYVSGNILPTDTLTYDIGSGAKRWRYGYFQNISSDYIDNAYDVVVGGNVTADSFIGSGAELTDLNVTGVMNVTGDFTGYAINISFLYGATGIGGIDLRGDPWYLGGTDLEIAEDLDVDKNLNVDGEAVIDGNLSAGNITTTGNVTADYFIGDGSFLTGIASGNPFDQSLNTTDDVQFETLNVNGSSYFNDTMNFNNVGGKLLSDGLMRVRGSWGGPTIFALMSFKPNVTSGSMYGFHINPTMNVEKTIYGILQEPKFASNVDQTFLAHKISYPSHKDTFDDDFKIIEESTTRSYFNSNGDIDINGITIGNSIGIVNIGGGEPTYEENMIKLTGGITEFGVTGNPIQRGIKFIGFGNRGTMSTIEMINSNGGDINIQADNSHYYTGLSKDVDMYFDGTNYIINMTTGGDVKIEGDLNVSGNFTGNDIYGGMWEHNHTGTELSFAVDGTYYPLFFQNATHLNGFIYDGGFNQTSNLTAMIGGIYSVTYMAIGDGQNNHAYYTSVFVNGVNEYQCESHHKMAAGGDVITQTGTCIIDIDTNDVIDLRTADIGNTGTGNYYGGNLNLNRIGN